MSLLSNYDSLWKAFVRPYRQSYHDYDLGPTSFLLGSTHVHRSDLILKNKRGLPLKCSHYEPFNLRTKTAEQAPCVIYLHCNTGCRLEAKPAVDLLLPLGISVFCFDFSGCGLSGGEFISLGWFEREDLEVVMKHLKTNQRVGKIALWGRSMGAVTALLYAEKDSTLTGLVLDSPFSNLTKLAEDVAISKTKLPSLVIKGALALIKQTVLKTTKLNMSNLSLEKVVERIHVPAMFAASKDDTFVKFWHIETLFKGYQGDKRLVHISGDHNEMREGKFMDEVGDFLQRALNHKKRTQEKENEKESLESDNKENSPFVSNTVSSLSVQTDKNNEGYKVPVIKLDLSAEESSFMETFSQSLKNISEKDFLHFFTTKDDDQFSAVPENHDPSLRSRAITHDGKLESKEIVPKSQFQDPLAFFEKEPSPEIPNERVERSISALNDYSMFYAKPGMSSVNNDIEGYFSSGKAVNSSSIHETTTDGSSNAGLKNGSIDESVLEDEGSPGLEKKYRMMKVGSHREVVKSFNFEKGSILTELKQKNTNVKKTAPMKVLGKATVGKKGFKPVFTQKLQSMKVVHSQIKEIGE